MSLIKKFSYIYEPIINYCQKISLNKFILKLLIFILLLIIGLLTYYFSREKEHTVNGLQIKLDLNWTEGKKSGIYTLYKTANRSQNSILAQIDLKKYNGTITYEILKETGNFKMIQIKSKQYGKPWIYIGKGNGIINGNGYSFIHIAEFPGVKWLGYPKSFSKGRNYQIIWNVIHCTDGEESKSAAENGAKYDKNRTDKASAHFYYDSENCVQSLYTFDIAHAAFYIANQRGVHHELCGLASQTRDQWLDNSSKATIDNSAKISAFVAQKYNIPLKWLNDDDIKNRRKGFVTHADISRVITGDHSDPGKYFPKDYFLERVDYWYNITYKK